MNRIEAIKIAETITNMELQAMFDKAKECITDWTVTSICNKGLTKGVAWNILASDFDLNHNYNNIVKVNMVREFGKYLPQYEKPITKTKPIINPNHQDPIFKNYKTNE